MVVGAVAGAFQVWSCVWKVSAMAAKDGQPVVLLIVRERPCAKEASC